MKHLEIRQKYSAARRIFNSLLGVSFGDETLCLMLHILLDIFRELKKLREKILPLLCKRLDLHEALMTTEEATTMPFISTSC